jgi:serine protease inhibitor
MLRRFVRLAVVPVLTLALAKPPSRGGDFPDPSTRVECDTDFAFRLYRTLAEDRKHFVLSPFSVSAALGMVSGGAEGRTLEELRSVRGGDMEDANYHSACAALRQSMQAVRYVDESGTVAHAHTEVGGGFGEPEPLPLPSIVNVDRPFLFILTDLRHRSILFMGRVQNPAPAGP